MLPKEIYDKITQYFGISDLPEEQHVEAISFRTFVNRLMNGEVVVDDPCYQYEHYESVIESEDRFYFIINIDSHYFLIDYNISTESIDIYYLNKFRRIFYFCGDNLYDQYEGKEVFDIKKVPVRDMNEVFHDMGFINVDEMDRIHDNLYSSFIYTLLCISNYDQTELQQYLDRYPFFEQDVYSDMNDFIQTEKPREIFGERCIEKIPVKETYVFTGYDLSKHYNWVEYSFDLTNPIT